MFAGIEIAGWTHLLCNAHFYLIAQVEEDLGIMSRFLAVRFERTGLWVDATLDAAHGGHWWMCSKDPTSDD